MIYHYKTVDDQGKTNQDVMAASSQKEVADSLKSKGLIVLEVLTENEWRKRKKKFSLSDIRIGSGISLMEKISLTQHLSTMITAGISLSESLDIISHDVKNPYFKKILEEAKYSLESGKPLSTCLSNYPKVFDRSFINMLKAGEISGNMENVLKYIAQKLQQDHELVSKVKSALVYPAVIFSALVIIGIIMLIVVVPKIADVFTRLKVDIPFTTKTLLFLSNIFVAQPLISIPVIVLIIIFLIFFIKSRIGKSFFGFLAHQIPYINNLAKQVDLSRFSHSFALLLKSGVPVTDALEISADTFSNEKTKKLVTGFRKKITEGAGLAESFRKTEDYFPLVMISMIAVGEKTGKLDIVLEELSEFYRRETELSLKTITSLIEPILMLLVGFAVGAMVISIIGPMYKIVSQLSN